MTVPYNVIYSIEGYMGQGFTREEAEKVMRHDIIFNKYLDGEATEAEMEELYAIQREVGL